ncbi:MAG TPA: RNA methyltransferase [Gemmataceae bacterium]|jgi:tRNA/rRNA methyltransferase
MNCRIVLVRPQFAANIGAASRVMRNMGLTDLVLVEPGASPTDPEARRLSTHGEEVLHRCRIVGDFGAAVADCVLVAATSARVGGLTRRQFVGPPEEITPHLIESMTSGPVALVFGPESSGLSNAEVSRCHYLVHIPTDPPYPVLNLAQAVAICTYELRRHWLRQTGAPTLLPPVDSPAPFVDQERAFEHLRQALEDVHFLWNEKAESLMHALRHLLGRAGPTSTELDMLHGLARQLRWFARHQSGLD